MGFGIGDECLHLREVQLCGRRHGESDKENGMRFIMESV